MSILTRYAIATSVILLIAFVLFATVTLSSIRRIYDREAVMLAEMISEHHSNYGLWALALFVAISIAANPKFPALAELALEWRAVLGPPRPSAGSTAPSSSIRQNCAAPVKNSIASTAWKNSPDSTTPPFFPSCIICHLLRILFFSRKALTLSCPGR